MSREDTGQGMEREDRGHTDRKASPRRNLPRVLPAQEGLKVAHPLVPATPGRRDAGTPGCRTEYRQLLGSGRAHVTLGWGEPGAEPMVHGPCQLPAGLARGPRGAPSTRAARATDGQASSSSEKPIRNRISTDHGNRPGPRAVHASCGGSSFLSEETTLPGARRPRDNVPSWVPSAEPQSVRTEGRPATCQRSSEQGRCLAEGGPIRRSKKILGSGQTSPGRGQEWWGTAGGWPAWALRGRSRGRQAGLAAVATSSVTRRWTRCLAGPPAGRLRAGPWAPGRGRWPWPPWAGSPAGSRGCPG